VFRRFSPRGVRGRLVAAIVSVALGVLGVSFFALHQRTGSDLEARIDDQLAGDLSEFRASPAGQAATAKELAAGSREFVKGQAYHPDSRIFSVEVGSAGKVVTNSEELIEAEQGESEPGEEEGAEATASSGGILAAEDGFNTVSAGGDARVRVLTEPIVSDGRVLGKFQVAQSLSQVAAAQDSLRSTFLIIGGAAIVVLLIAAIWIATLLARPLDRIAGFAAGVGEGDLKRRLDENRGPAEVQSLTNSLNRMLERLQRAFEREREFVADASHELRTPITIAQGELDLLRREAAQPERERLDIVRRELARMERLIADMLSLAREDAARLLSVRSVPVDDILDDLRRDLPLLGPRRYCVGSLEGTIDADPDRIAQVLRNLARNAVTHTGADGVVEVDAEECPAGARFRIRDDGPGIASDEAAHLFERFYRADESRARDTEGSGLGLAIARAIVEAHGGRIWAEPGPGGVVAFELPGYHPVPGREG
jgi:two-component system OmpR family sensor kinase